MYVRYVEDFLQIRFALDTIHRCRNPRHTRTVGQYLPIVRRRNFQRTAELDMVSQAAPRRDEVSGCPRVDVERVLERIPREDCEYRVGRRLRCSWLVGLTALLASGLLA